MFPIKNVKIKKVLCKAGAVMGASRGRARKALQGRGGRFDLKKWEDSKLSEGLHVPEVPSKQRQGGRRWRGKEGILGRLEKDAGEVVMGPENRGGVGTC